MESTINIAAVLAELENLKIENARLTKELDAAKLVARIDAKTGLFNALHLKEALAAEFGRVNRDMYSSLSLMVIDLDHFKRINDEHGHSTGDAVLVKVAQVIKDNVRQHDIACRFGGEEMVVVMPDTNAADALVAAERLRAAIASAVQCRADLTVTASIGVATAEGSFSASQNELFDAADRAVYVAKGDGRNCVRVSETV